MTLPKIGTIYFGYQGVPPACRGPRGVEPGREIVDNSVMNPDQMDQLLRSMLEDHRLSRAERRVLRDLPQDRGLDNERLAVFRSRAFEIARQAVRTDDQVVIDWLEDAIKSLLPRDQQQPEVRGKARFSPGLDCLRAIVGEFDRCRQAADVCVFTITDNRIVEAMLEAHGRGVVLRVITDDDKSLDRGSDIQRLREAGVAVRMDSTPHHMHHKFAVFDSACVLTGSYNWTRSAADVNHENLVIAHEGALVHAFSQTFEHLWREFASAPTPLR